MTDDDLNPNPWVRAVERDYALKKLERYPRPSHTGKSKVRLAMHEVLYVYQPQGINQNIVVSHQHYPLDSRAAIKATMAHFADPSKEPILWYVQMPYHSVIVFRDIKYALISVEYLNKPDPVEGRGGKKRYVIDKQFLTMRRLIDIPVESEVWIDAKISEILK